MTLYLDTSSLVKLYVTESGSKVVRQLVGDANVVATSVVAYAETRAALARLRRELAEKKRLRGFDSIHLASFAEVSRRAGTGDTRFSSFDDRLNQAAQKVTRTLERSQR